MTDWRVENAKGLKDLGLRRKKYKKWNERWDHDHCAGCWATFAKFDGPEIQHEGYATYNDYKFGADYDWVCLPCFSDLREEMGWTEVP
jgi:hypothetical protein